jgi:hypothetical protein
MATETILEKLHALEESPWNDLRGKQLDARGLAGKLKKYEVPSPTSVRVGDKTPRGYKREWLVDIWVRYLPPSPAKGATSATPQHSGSAGSESVADSGPSVADVPPHVADSQHSIHAHVADVADVADKSEDGATSNGHRTHCRDCGTELRQPLQARGTCGPCYFRTKDWAPQ